MGSLHQTPPNSRFLEQAGWRYQHVTLGVKGGQLDTRGCTVDPDPERYAKSTGLQHACLFASSLFNNRRLAAFYQDSYESEDRPNADDLLEATNPARQRIVYACDWEDPKETTAFHISANVPDGVARSNIFVKEHWVDLLGALLADRASWTESDHRLVCFVGWQIFRELSHEGGSYLLLQGSIKSSDSPLRATAWGMQGFMVEDGRKGIPEDKKKHKGERGLYMESKAGGMLGLVGSKTTDGEWEDLVVFRPDWQQPWKRLPIETIRALLTCDAQTIDRLVPITREESANDLPAVRYQDIAPRLKCSGRGALPGSPRKGVILAPGVDIRPDGVKF